MSMFIGSQAPQSGRRCGRYLFCCFRMEGRDVSPCCVRSDRPPPSVSELAKQEAEQANVTELDIKVSNSSATGAAGRRSYG
jgi:hypothetical protein